MDANLTAQDKELRESLRAVLTEGSPLLGEYLVKEKLIPREVEGILGLTMPLIQRHCALLVAGAYEAAAKLGDKEIAVSELMEKDTWHRAWISSARHFSEAIRALTLADAAQAIAEHDHHVHVTALREELEHALGHLSGKQCCEGDACPLGDALAEREREVAAAERERIAAKHRPVVRSEDIICECGAFLISRLVQREPHELQHKWTEHIRALASPERGEADSKNG